MGLIKEAIGVMAIAIVIIFIPLEMLVSPSLDIGNVVEEIKEDAN